MLNIFKVNKALRQAKEHVEEVNRINDDLMKLSGEQNQMIAEQQETIEALQEQLEKELRKNQPQ